MLNFIRKLLSKLYRKLGISADLGYIGTGVSLPPPLSKEEELRLTLLFTNADDSPAARETAEQAKNTLIFALLFILRKNLKTQVFALKTSSRSARSDLSKPSTHFARTGTSSLQPTQAAALKMKSLCICAKP